MKSRYSYTIVIGLALWIDVGVAFGGEPQQHRSISEKARMATHVIVGKMESIRVLDRSSGMPVVNPIDVLGDSQCFEATILVDSSLSEESQYTLRRGARVKVRFGSRKSDTLSNHERRLNRERIYWLTMDAEISARDNYFFPFFGEANLSDSPDRLMLVKKSIKNIDEFFTMELGDDAKK